MKRSLGVLDAGQKKLTKSYEPSKILACLVYARNEPIAVEGNQDSAENPKPSK